MATLPGVNTLVWSGRADSDIEQISLYELRNEIGSIVIVKKSDGLQSKIPSLAGFQSSSKYFNPGCGGIFFLKSSVEIDDVVPTNLQSDSGRLIPTYAEQIKTVGAEGGLYKMTTSFKNNRPLYKLIQDISWYIWWDSTDEVWICSRGEVSKSVTHLINKNCLPQHGVYENTEYSEFTQTTENWDCVNVSEFNEPVITMNGDYCAVGYYNEKPVFVSCNGEWFLYFDSVQWIISNVPFTREGIWITNSSTKLSTPFNNASGLNGSDETLNQTGKIINLGVAEGSLKIEDGDSYIFSEDLDTSITSE